MLSAIRIPTGISCFYELISLESKSVRALPLSMRTDGDAAWRKGQPGDGVRGGSA